MPTDLSLSRSSGQTRRCSRSYSSMASALMRSLNAYLGIARHHGPVLFGALGRNAVEVAALAEGGHRVRRKASRLAPFADGGADVRGEGVFQAVLGVHQI